jgi:guanylate kinase
MPVPPIERRGLMLVLSSPSGAGKTTISRRLLALDDNLTLSISMTTRPKRPGETDGIDYNFVAEAHFKEMVERGEFLEHARVFDHYYGTPRAPVEAALAAGRDMLFDVDWQGAQQMVEGAQDDLVSVFILPPSTAELERRLHSRAQDSNEVVAARMAKAADEMSHWDAYGYIIINDDLEDSVCGARAVLDAERLSRRRQLGLGDLVKQLRGEH